MCIGEGRLGFFWMVSPRKAFILPSVIGPGDLRRRGRQIRLLRNSRLFAIFRIRIHQLLSPLSPGRSPAASPLIDSA